MKCILGGLKPEDNPVTVDTQCNAIEIANYYKEQAMYAFSIGGVNNEILKAEKALELIRKKKLTEGLQLSFYKACRNKIFEDSDDFYKTLKTLEEYGYVVLDEKLSANNKPAIYVYVNPKVFLN